MYIPDKGDIVWLNFEPSPKTPLTDEMPGLKLLGTETIYAPQSVVFAGVVRGRVVARAGAVVAGRPGGRFVK